MITKEREGGNIDDGMPLHRQRHSSGYKTCRFRQMALRMMSTMKRMDAPAMIGWLSFALFVQISVMQYMMKPAAIPFVMP